MDKYFLKQHKSVLGFWIISYYTDKFNGRRFIYINDRGAGSKEFSSIAQLKKSIA